MEAARAMAKSLILYLAFLLAGSPLALAEEPSGLMRWLGETVYVPSYSRVYTQENRRERLASTLVVHNVDPESEISLERVAYYDQAGQLLTELLAAPVTLGSLESKSFLTAISDDKGGVGANYIVEWQSATPVVSPVIEAIMIGGAGTQGISFLSRGVAISRTAAPGGEQ